MEPVVKDAEDGEEQTDTDQDQHTDTDRTEGEDSVTTPSQSRSPSVYAQDPEVDVFDGYPFKGCHSVVIDDDEENSYLGDEDDEYEEDEEEVPISKSPYPRMLGIRKAPWPTRKIRRRRLRLKRSARLSPEPRRLDLQHCLQRPLWRKRSLPSNLRNLQRSLNPRLP